VWERNSWNGRAAIVAGAETVAAPAACKRPPPPRWMHARVCTPGRREMKSALPVLSRRALPVRLIASSRTGLASNQFCSGVRGRQRPVCDWRHRFDLTALYAWLSSCVWCRYHQKPSVNDGLPTSRDSSCSVNRQLTTI